MVRRCSVMRMPFSTQSFSMRSDKRGSRESVDARIGLSGGLRKVETHYQRVNPSGFAAVVVEKPPARLVESQPLVEGDGRVVVDCHLEEGLRHAPLARHAERGRHKGLGD